MSAVNCSEVDITKLITVNNPLNETERNKQSKFKIWTGFMNEQFIILPEITLTEGGIFKYTDSNKEFYQKGEYDPKRMAITIPIDDPTQEGSEEYKKFFESIDKYAVTDEFIKKLVGTEDFSDFKEVLNYQPLVKDPRDPKKKKIGEKKEPTLKFKNVKLSFKVNKQFSEPQVMTNILYSKDGNPDNVAELDTTDFKIIEKYIGKNAKIIPIITPKSIYITKSEYKYGIRFEIVQLMILDKGTVFSSGKQSFISFGKFQTKPNKKIPFNDDIEEGIEQQKKPDLIEQTLRGNIQNTITGKKVNDDDNETDEIEKTSKKSSKQKKDKKSKKSKKNQPPADAPDSDSETDSDEN